jgi:hypothetical protein
MLLKIEKINLKGNWCGMVWCGMVWYGMVWYVVWCVVWYGMVWYFVAHCAMLSSSSCTMNFVFLSKLFCKKIEEFVDGSQGRTSSCSQENASTLFRYCQA